jgi:alpha-tubulin suppressor-like RCC1 family protein
MPLTRIQAGSFATGAIQTVDLSSNTTATFATSASVAEFATSLAPKVSSVNVANNAFAVLDDTAVNTGGGYIVVTGTNFAEGVTVLVDTTPAPVITRVNSTTLRVQVPAKVAASYNLFVVNPDGGTGIRVAGVTYSADPNWVTASPLNNQSNSVSFNLNFSATGATSYSVAAGSTLPANTTLLANGYFYGAVTVETQTTYNFNVVATDAELQDSPKTFGLTVTTGPKYYTYTSGTGSYGVSGLNNTILRSSPTQIGAANSWVSLSIVSDRVWAIKPDGTLWAWGENETGSLGIGSGNLVHRSSPVQVGTDTDWSKISGNAGIKTNGTLWRWGDNTHGQIGNLDRLFVYTPQQIGAATDWQSVSNSTSGSLFFAIKTNGTLWTCGYNIVGSLGINSTINRSSPVQVGTDTNWKQVWADSDGGYGEVFAIKTNGTLWGWGYSAYGRALGNGPTGISYRSSPTQVGALTNWSQVSKSIAVKTDGTLWSWGTDRFGSTIVGNQNSPVQAGSGYRSVTRSMTNGAATKTDGTLWVWGFNGNGNLGLNNNTQSVGLTQVGTGNNWIDICETKGYYNDLYAIEYK